VKICYLINQYPKVSHSFIRREILELEHRGLQVLRIALRGWDQPLVDEQDVAEQIKTRYILKCNGLAILTYVVRQATRLLPFLRALGLVASLARKSDKSLLKHAICLIEACIAAQWIRAEGTTHIHAHFGTNSAEVALLASVLTGVPYSFTAHGPEEFDHPEGLCLREKIRHAHRVVAISSFGRSQLYRWAATGDWPRIQVVRCGLDDTFLAMPAPSSVATDTFVCVGRLNEQKGQLLLLDALHLVLSRGHSCRLVFAGDGEMRHQIEERAQALDVHGHILITGWVDSTEIRRQIIGARALVLPSFAEGLPVVIMEALALSRPVITTYVAGIPELVTHGESGWLVPAGDVTSLADAMIDCLCRDDAILNKMGEFGREQVLDRHDIRKETDKLIGIFSSH
jgi:colanic acid/amylovoran biosynthesis glycosyltransferase